MSQVLVITIESYPRVQKLDPAKVAKFVRDIIPVFYDKNTSVKLFVEHCEALLKLVNDSEIPYLTMLVKNKIIGEVRLQIQDEDQIS